MMILIMGGRGSAGSWKDPSCAPLTYGVFQQTHPPPSMPPLTYGVCPGCCPSSCILSTYMNIPAPASHNLMACAFLVQGNVQYKLKASNKEDDTVHIVEARVLGQDGQILA